ncbi:hypothetical protein HDU80_009315, partial [Chytriomyces hyalinus]
MSEEHAGFKCPQNVGEYPRSVKAAVGDGSNASNSTSVSSRDRERESREVSGEGGGGRSISSSSNAVTLSLSSSEKRQSDNLHERGDDKRARNSYRSRSRSPIKRNGSISGSSTSRAIVVEDKRSTSTRPTETNGSSGSNAARRDSTSSGSSGFSLLTHSERGSVCRDFNNNKCALVDT